MLPAVRKQLVPGVHLTYIKSEKFKTSLLSVTMLAAWGLQVVMQIPSLVRFKFKFRPKLNFKDKYIISAMKLALPMLISTWVQPLYTIVNTRLASGIYKGVSSLEYANRLYLVITGVFSFVVTNLMFPKMSRANVSGEENEAKNMLVVSLKAITLIILPVMAMFIILAKPVIAVLYQHGDFLLSDTIRTGTALSFYATGMIGMAYNEILSKSFFSMQNSKTPMITALISMAANIAVAYTLAGHIGISGLALATACGSSVNAILNYIFMRKYYKTLFTRTDVVNLCKIIVSSILMGLVMYIIYSLLKTQFELGFYGGIVIGGISAL